VKSRLVILVLVVSLFGFTNVLAQDGGKNPTPPGPTIKDTPTPPPPIPTAVSVPTPPVSTPPASTPPVFPPPNTTITVSNTLGDTVCYLYIAPSDSKVWGDDRLGSNQTLATDAENTIPLEASGVYDMQALDCQGNVLDELWHIAIGETWHWFVGYPTLIVVNHTGSPIEAVYISPVTDKNWGDNQLVDAEVIAVEQRRDFSLAPGQYDLAATDDQGNVIEQVNAVEIDKDIQWDIVGEVPDTGVEFDNLSDTTVCYIYIWDYATNSWVGEALGSDTIPPGQFIVYPDPPIAGTWGLQAQDCSGNVIYQENVTVTPGQTYLLWFIR